MTMQMDLNESSISVDVSFVNNAGEGITGLTYQTAPAIYWSYGRSLDVGITLVNLATLDAAYTSGGFKERGGGDYRLDLPNTMWTARRFIKLRTDDPEKILIFPYIQVGFAPTYAITVPNKLVTASRVPDVLPFTRGTTQRLRFRDIGTVTEAWFAIKESKEDADNDAIIYIKMSEGLLRVNGEAAADETKGQLIQDGQHLIFYLHESIASEIIAGQNLVYGLKVKIGTDITMPRSGPVEIEGDLPKAYV